MNQSNKKPSLKNKIDFAVIFSVRNANPNGDPRDGNRPRKNYEGFGEVSDVCLKRKIRNRLQDMGESIFVQMDDRRSPGDDCRSLNARIAAAGFKDDITAEKTCEKWLDVRAFGQVFAFKAKGKGKGKSKKNDESGDGSEDSDSVSIGVRGPVTIQSAFSTEKLYPTELPITKSVNLEIPQNKKGEELPDKKGSDTMGMKHRIDRGIYVAYGAMSPQLASKTGFSDDDAEKIKLALQTLFVNDESSARPEGSMSVMKVVWWNHNCPSGQYSSAKVHDSLRKLLQADGTFDETALKADLKDLTPELLDELVKAPNEK